MKLDKYFAAVFVLWLASFLVYLNFFDILIPGLPNGSYRAVVGAWFAVPSFILSVGQILISGFIISAAVHLFGGKVRPSRSLFTASLMVFLFSLTYVIFPFFGPFYYIIFYAGGVPPYVLAIEVAWSAALLAVSTLLISKLHKMELRLALLTTIITGIFIVVAAS